MVKRKKRLIKQIKGLEKQEGKHKNKLKVEKGRLDTTPDYWKKEIEEKFKEIKKEDEEYLEEDKDK